jgi:hypothetical protein
MNIAVIIIIIIIIIIAAAAATIITAIAFQHTLLLGAKSHKVEFYSVEAQCLYF